MSAYQPAFLPSGGLHPITLVKDQAIQILRRMGFALVDGPEIETEFHCFDALNTPDDHPARNEKDTFYFDSGKLLRTHTSSVQIRSMEQSSVPLRIIGLYRLPPRRRRRHSPSRVHATRSPLRGRRCKTGRPQRALLEYFLKEMFGEATEVRFRPHFFPFTEPSFEIDVKLKARGQEPKWIEIAGCGMVDPAVFEAICESRGDRVFDPEKVTGLPSAWGSTDFTMIQAGMKDIRPLVENDVRFLSQFA